MEAVIASNNSTVLSDDSGLMSDVFKVMISSTVLDLPEHREQLRDACLKVGMMPLMMEHSPANTDDGAAESIRLVKEADVYVGILAHRYGYVPATKNRRKISVTELEYDQAVKRDIPRLMFVMHADHLLKIADVQFENYERLERFKERVRNEQVVNFFKSPEDVRAQAIHSLSSLRSTQRHDLNELLETPAAPEVYVAHPYTLLRTRDLIGRRNELRFLTDWVTGKEIKSDGCKVPGNSVSIMSVIGMGGMGKSALTWKWFNDVAPRKMKDLAGRMWWSFYETRDFDQFITHALAYATRQPISKVEQNPATDLQNKLLAILGRKRFLFVLDGLERILTEYAQVGDSMSDDIEMRPPKSPRTPRDPRAASFLTKLAQVKESRILVSSQLYPANLEREDGKPIRGTFRLCLDGLSDQDAFKLWNDFDVSGSREDLTAVFKTVGNHPLVIQALAGEVSAYRNAPRSFEAWRDAHPDFDPTECDSTRDKIIHLLEFPLRGLDEKAMQTLGTICALRMPATYDALRESMIGDGKVFTGVVELNSALTELQDARKLIGWDKARNRYDVHSIVRRVVWRGLSDYKKRIVLTDLEKYLETIPPIDHRKANSLDDISPFIELYQIRIQLERYDEAATLFLERLKKIVFYRVTANQQIVDLLKGLFPGGSELPRVSDQKKQVGILLAMADAYAFTGHEREAKTFYERSNELAEATDNRVELAQGLQGMALTLARLGELHHSEVSGWQALLIAREKNHSYWEARSARKLGFVLACRGRLPEAITILDRARRAFETLDENHWVGATQSYQALCKYWSGDYETAKQLARAGYELVREDYCEPCSLASRRLAALSALALGQMDAAKDLYDVLENARLAGLVREILESLQAVARFERDNGNLRQAESWLEELWKLAEAGSYRLIYSDALNLLAQIERDRANAKAAIRAAAEAYRQAWCDGPPFAYHWGLEEAKRHLHELGAVAPEMPDFDESRFTEMPKVEIEPNDEFYAGELSPK